VHPHPTEETFYKVETPWREILDFDTVITFIYMFFAEVSLIFSSKYAHAGS
jgi:hypothetical protein